MRFENITREAWIAIIGLLMVGWMSGEFGAYAAFALLAGLLFMARGLFESDTTERTARRSRSTTTRAPRRGDDTDDYDIFQDNAPLPSPAKDSATKDGVQKHALQAVRAAGGNPETLKVMPVDLGLLSFRGGDDPVIHQTAPVGDDVDYVQPYVQLRVPQSATGRIRFELLDSQRLSVYVFEDVYQLKRGNNLILPKTRLPIQDTLDMDGKWTLVISVQGQESGTRRELARHTFGWEDTEAVASGIRAHIAEDGEISNELRAALADNRNQKMSLDELLSFQDGKHPHS